MRFIYGPIPSSQTFDPKEEGWTPLGGTDVDASRFAVIAGLLSVPFIVPAVWVLLSSRSEIRGFLLGNPLYFVAFLILLVALIPVHEFIHTLAYLKGLRSPRLMMGAWINRGMFYVIYDAPMPRHRVLLMSVMPFMLLSVLPVVCLLLLELQQEWMVLGWFLILIHASLCTGDFLVWWRLGFCVPHGAWIHNNGWTTYWTTEYDPKDPHNNNLPLLHLIFR